MKTSLLLILVTILLSFVFTSTTTTTVAFASPSPSFSSCSCTHLSELALTWPELSLLPPASLHSLLTRLRSLDDETASSPSRAVSRAVATTTTTTTTNTTSCPDSGAALGEEPDAGAAEDEPELSDSDATTIRNGKYGVIPAVFVLALGASIMPWVSASLSSRYGVDFISFGACLSSGVIIGAGFSHMMPDAEEAWTNYFDLRGSSGLADPEDVGYPFAPLIAIATMLTLVFVDNYVVRGGIDGSGHAHAHGKHHSHLLPTDMSRGGRPDQHNHKHDHDHTQGKSIEMTPAKVVDDEERKEAMIAVTLDDGMRSSSALSLSKDEAGSVTTSASVSATALDAEERLRQREALVSAWVFFVALAIHSVFDGLSVGVEDSISGFSSMLVAVLVHKGLDGFALGIPIYYAKLPRLHTAAALIFCAGMTPLGIGIGMAATEGANGESGQLAKAIILSMSTGSFFFIGLLELLPAGLSQPEWLRLKMAIIAFGWGIMALLAKWV